MPRTFLYQEVESAVAISAELHSHTMFGEVVNQRAWLNRPGESWRVCIHAAVLFEIAAGSQRVVWGETHDYYVAIETLVEEMMRQDDLEIGRAIRAAIERSVSRSS